MNHGSPVVHLWLTCGSPVVHLWFTCGSPVVHLWFTVIHLWFRGHIQPRSAMFGHGQGWPDLGQSWLAMTSQRQAAASLLWQCLATARGRQTLADHGWPLPAKWRAMASPGRQCLATARSSQSMAGHGWTWPAKGQARFPPASGNRKKQN